MWYPIRDFTLGEAKKFLRNDFLKVVKRTKYLYVDKKPKKSVGRGYFEPILLCLCWCDFLGALYCGDGNPTWHGGLGSTKRSKIFIENILGTINPDYKNMSDDLIAVYRHGTVHAYAPLRGFEIKLSDNLGHLNKNNGRLTISLEDFLNDLLEGVKYFSKVLHKDSQALTPGSLVAFNKARKELN